MNLTNADALLIHQLCQEEINKLTFQNEQPWVVFEPETTKTQRQNKIDQYEDLAAKMRTFLIEQNHAQ